MNWPKVVTRQRLLVVVALLLCVTVGVPYMSNHRPPRRAFVNRPVAVVLPSAAERQKAAEAAALFDYVARPSITVESTVAGEHPFYTSQRITITHDGEEPIPMLLVLPRQHREPCPVVILLHGLNDCKDSIVDDYAAHLARHGMASLAYDLAEHGERPNEGGEWWQLASRYNMLGFAMLTRQSVVDGRRVIDYIGERKDLDQSRTAVMGNSLGSYIGCLLANVDSRVCGLVMNAGGTKSNLLELFEKNPAIGEFAGSYRPIIHAPGIAPRPVLMLNGLHDEVFVAADANLVYESFGRPKDIIWYESGHCLPPQATADAVQWLSRLLADE